MTKWGLFFCVYVQVIGVWSALNAILEKFQTTCEGATEKGREGVGETEIERDREDLLADVQQWDVWPKLCQAPKFQHNRDRLSPSPQPLILHYCHFRPIFVKGPRVCVHVWRVCVCVRANIKIGVKFTVDYSLIHYAECVLNYVKRRAHETGDLRGKVTIRGGDQGGRSGGDGPWGHVWLSTEASKAFKHSKASSGPHVDLVWAGLRPVAPLLRAVCSSQGSSGAFYRFIPCASFFDLSKLNLSFQK